MSRTIIPNNEAAERLGFMPNVSDNYLLGAICLAVDGPVHRDRFEPEDNRLVTFPYEMTEEEADKLSIRIKNLTLDRNKTLMQVRIDNSSSFVDERAFLEYCYDFAIFLEISGGYKCI